MILGMIPVSIMLAIGFMASAVVSQSNTVDRSKNPKFLFPAKPDETYHTQDVLMVQYISFFEIVELWTFCQQGVGRYITQQRVPGFNATVPVQLNFTSADPCWFNIRTGDPYDTTFSDNSYAFNLIGQRRASGPETFKLDDTSSPLTASPSPSSESRLATSSLSAVSSAQTLQTTTISTSLDNLATTISSASGTSRTQSSQTAVTKAADSPPSAPANPKRLHPAVWAAIGFGIAVVVIASVAAGIYLWRRRSSTSAQNLVAASDKAYETSPGSKPQWRYGGELDSSWTPIEMGSTQYAVELSSGQEATTSARAPSGESGCLGSVGNYTHGRGGGFELS